MHFGGDIYYYIIHIIYNIMERIFFFVLVLKVESEALYMLAKYSTTELHIPGPDWYINNLLANSWDKDPQQANWGIGSSHCSNSVEKPSSPGTVSLFSACDLSEMGPPNYIVFSCSLCCWSTQNVNTQLVTYVSLIQNVSDQTYFWLRI